jgi:peptide/nickel transport system substrate-binding protein
LSEAIIGTYEQKDLPAIATSLLSEPLIKLDASGLPQPNLAEKWEVNKEGTEYRVTLKSNLYWTDGTPLDANDIAIAIPEANVEVPDNKTIVFKLAEPFAPFLTLLTKPVLKKDGMTGVGPYYISQIKKDGNYVQKMVLKSKNLDMPQTTLRFYGNEKLAKEALELGEVQVILGITDMDSYVNQHVLTSMSVTNYSELVTIIYNVKDPILADENLRAGLSYAAPGIRGEVEAPTSIPPKNWAFNKDVRDYLDNTDKAAASLKKVQNLQNSAIILTTIGSLQDTGQRIIEAWQKAGVKANLQVQSGVPQNFQALLITESIPKDPDQYALWHSTQTKTNFSQLSSPRIDKDLEDGRKTIDINARKTNYQDFQRVLLEQAPATFMYFPKYNVVYLIKSGDTMKKIIDRQLANL